MLPVAGIAGALGSVVGGMFQADAIERRTRERLRQMGLQAKAAIGEATARAAVSGAEMGSSTIQLHLSKMREQYDLAAKNVIDASEDAQRNSWFQTMGSFASAMGSSMAGLSGGSADPFKGAFEGMPETSPGIKMPDFEWVR